MSSLADCLSRPTAYDWGNFTANSTKGHPMQEQAKQTGDVRVALVGDIVGKPGMKIASQAGPWLKRQLQIDALIANAENAADGTGLRVKQYERLMESGFDGITLGDHVYRKREIVEVLNSRTNIVRPANFPPTAPGKGWAVLTIGEHSLVIISLLGRVFMRPVDCPFMALDRILEEVAQLPSPPKMILVDLHAEATSDKQALARYADGRVSAVLGTHTHVTTADEQILPKGTAFQCDVGMTGPFESILGREIAPVVATNLTFDPNSFDVATDDLRICLTWVDLDPITGHAKQIGRVQWKEAMIPKNPGTDPHP